MYAARKVQKRFGFLALFAHKHYFASIDDNQMAETLPLEYELEMDTRNLNLKIHPNLQTELNSPIKVLHLSTVPYLKQRDVLDFEPITFHPLDQNTLVTKEIKKYKTTIEREIYSVQLEADSKEVEQNVEGVKQLLDKFQELPENRYKKLEILMNSEQIAKSELRFNVTHDKMVVSTLNDDNKQISNEESLTGLPTKLWELNSENRRKNILKALSKDLKSSIAHVYDMSFDFPKTLQKNRDFFTVGWVNSNMDRMSRTYLYWNSQTSKQERPKYEVCYFQEMQTSPNTPLDYEYMMKNAPNDRLRAKLRYGESCKTGTKVVLDANMTRSNQLKEMLENSAIAKKCQEEIKKGNKALRACQLATETAEVRDQFDLLIQPSDDAPKNLREIIDSFVDLLSILYPEARVNKEMNNVTKITMYRPSSNEMQNLLMLIPRLNAFDKLNVNLETLRPLKTQIMETQQLLKDSLPKNQGKGKLQNFKKYINI